MFVANAGAVAEQLLLPAVIPHFLLLLRTLVVELSWSFCGVGGQDFTTWNISTL